LRGRGQKSLFVFLKINIEHLDPLQLG
jgi:hypothetical protein